MEEERRQWIMNIRAELRRPPPIPKRWSICKVPTILRSVNEDAYTPHDVSIGPFHHGKEKLKTMKDYKPQFLRSLCRRSQNPEEEILENCCNAILGLEEKVRACYAEPIEPDKYKLATILLYDSGFMIELFMRSTTTVLIERGNPIDMTIWTRAKLRRDLALLENQIPWDVPQSMFDIIRPDGDGHPSLKTRALQFFELTIVSEEFFESRTNARHLLHLLHNFVLPTSFITLGIKEECIPCATSLGQAGVVFQKKRTDEHFCVEFESGTFRIPELIIDDNTESLFRNLAAFEQCQLDIFEYVTSYFMLMDKLIDTAEDVELLQQNGILQNYMGRADDVSNLFNNFRNHLVLKEFYNAGLCKEVNTYANSLWNRNIAALRRDYFKNPWSIISFAAAFILLLLTFLQTLYTVSSYYRG